MNLQEFKAWFEGFTENMKGAPSEKAWKRIQERVSEITEKPTEVRYFYDHYWRPYFTSGYASVSQAVKIAGSAFPGSTMTVSHGTTDAQSCRYANAQCCGDSIPTFQNNVQAFSALGSLEAKAN